MKPAKQRIDNVVVVDPNSDDYEPFVTQLVDDAVRVTLFSRAEEALRAPGTSASALWLVNVLLPDMTGVGLLNLIRRRQHRSKIFLVGDAYSLADELAARTAGATAYLCKPPTVEWLSAIEPHCRSPATRARAGPSRVRKID